MLLSLALIFTLGIFFGGILEKLHLPRLLAMLLVGIVIGPYALNLLDANILEISADLRKIALIIILTRAGLSLDLTELKKVGRPAFMMCFVPATFEILAMLYFAPKFLGLSLLESAILGTVVAAVSPAVVVPKMLKLMDEGYGTEQSIPQLIMAGASVDDVFVIVLFTAFTSLASGGTVDAAYFLVIPTSILFGLIVGFILGYVLARIFEKLPLRETVKVLIFLSVSFFLVTFEDSISGNIGFSGLLAIMAMGVSLQRVKPLIAKSLAVKFNELWVAAEVLLFVLVGATVDVSYAMSAGLMALILLFSVLVFRMLGVYVCLVGTKLSMKERLFCMIAYCPKATVQAAIGSIPLSMGLSCGNIVLTVAVLAILITAPLGAFFVDLTYKKFLTKA